MQTKKRTLLDYFGPSTSKKAKQEGDETTLNNNNENKENSKEKQKLPDLEFKQNERFRLKEPLVWKEIHRYEWIQQLMEKTNSKQQQCKVYLLPKDCVLVYVPCFLDGEYCQSMMPELESLKVKEGKVYEAVTPRASLWMSDDEALKSVSYAEGQKVNSITPQIKSMMNELNALLGVQLNSVLVNKYRKEKIYDEKGNWVRGAGKESILDHRDKEYIFTERPLIISISIGQKRKFLIKYFEEGKVLHNLEFALGKGDLFIMGGNTNHFATHGIPKEPNLNVTEDRYSLTFRPVATRRW